MLFAIVFSALFAHATPPLTPVDLAKYQDCVTDDDCVYVQNGSCDCNNGGTTVAINKTKRDEFLKLFEKTECTHINGASCTNGIPRCEHNRCLYYARVIPPSYTKKKKN